MDWRRATKAPQRWRFLLSQTLGAIGRDGIEDEADVTATAMAFKLPPALGALSLW